MKTKTQVILSIMHVVFWVTFVGMCIRTGAVVISFIVSLFINSDGAKNLYMGFDLSGLYNHGYWHYIGFMMMIISIMSQKALISYLVIKIFMQMNVDRPFSRKVSELITRISHVALSAGLMALAAGFYSGWLNHRGVNMNEEWGSSELLFLAGVIFIIAQIFKKGIEIQSENELKV